VGEGGGERDYHQDGSATIEIKYIKVVVVIVKPKITSI
jgi:hypothetical protein